MKHYIKIIFSLFLGLTLANCVFSDEDDLSTQDLLIGQWQLSSKVINGTAVEMNDENICDFYYTNEFTYNKKIETFYSPTGDETICTFESTTSYDYSVDKNIITVNNIDSEILQLTTSKLHVKIDATTELTFEKIN